MSFTNPLQNYSNTYLVILKSKVDVLWNIANGYILYVFIFTETKF